MVKIRTPKNKIHYFISFAMTGARHVSFFEITKEGRIISSRQNFTWEQLMRLGKPIKNDYRTKTIKAGTTPETIPEKETNHQK